MDRKVIPKTLHYCFGMAPDFGGKPWSLIHYVGVASAIHRIQPNSVNFYYEYEPSGPWWELTKPLVSPIKIKAPREIYGRPVTHPAHRADVVRLQKLIEHGGIYLDADVVVHRSFDDLLGHSTVLGREGFDDANPSAANAIILGEAQAPFLLRWIEEYRTFRGDEGYWSEHSVQRPAELAKQYPDEITMLPPTAFFYPLWSPEDVDWIFGSTRPIPEGAYANHLWESKAWTKYLDHLTPGRVRREDSNFHRWARPYVSGLPDDLGAAPFYYKLRRYAKRLKSKS